MVSTEECWLVQSTRLYSFLKHPHKQVCANASPMDSARYMTDLLALIQRISQTSQPWTFHHCESTHLRQRHSSTNIIKANSSQTKTLMGLFPQATLARSVRWFSPVSIGLSSMRPLLTRGYLPNKIVSFLTSSLAMASRRR